MTDEIKTPTDDTPELPTYDGPQITIEEEMKTSYLDYAMSVIVSRAIPDLRDWLNLFTVEFSMQCMKTGTHTINLTGSLQNQLVM